MPTATITPFRQRPYDPCQTGIHICGADDVRREFFSEANFAMPYQAAMAAFNLAQAELQIRDDEPMDFVVDLMRDGDIVADFGISRQMLARVTEILSRHAADALADNDNQRPEPQR